VDVLSDALASLELGSELYLRARFRGAFAVSVPAEALRIRFHLVIQGRCFVGICGDGFREVGPGEMVLVPHGAAHVLASHPRAVAQPLAELLARAGPTGAGEIEHGAGSPEVRVVCGAFFHRDTPSPLLSFLPARLQLRPGEVDRYAWMESLLAHLDHEAREREIGHGEITRRLSEILLVELLRAHAERSRGPGLLAALGDPALRRALEALHAAPQRPWTLAELARESGASRSVLSERFRERLGTSPMRYLAGRRLEKARQLLRRRDLSVGEIAGSVGYASEAAFNRAFKEAYGAPPGRLRSELARGGLSSAG
jgi:AraC-like DNA-binding protein